MSLKLAVEKKAAAKGYTLKYEEETRQNFWFLLDGDDFLIAREKGLFAINKILAQLPNLITGEVPPPPPPPTVGWTEEHSTPLYQEHYKCPNSIPGCSCYNAKELVCYRSGCLRYASCWGICFQHSELKMWGNLTKLAVEKTDKLKEAGKWDEIVERNRTGDLPHPFHKKLTIAWTAVQEMLKPPPAQDIWERPVNVEDIALLAEMLDFELEPSKYGNGFFVKQNGKRVSEMIVGVHGLNTFMINWVKTNT